MAAPVSAKNQTRFVLFSFLLAAGLLLALTLTFQPQPAAALGNIYYVDRRTTGDNTGGSWENAFPRLQPALDAATPGDQIWVAAGVYTPTNTASRTAAFQLKKGVALYGGFEGGEDELDERSWLSNPTVLSGDLDGDDLTDERGVLTSTAGIVGSNAFHVLVGSAVTQTAVLDGFFITGGKADGSDPNRDGGGMWLVSSNPSLSRLWLSGNYAINDGGGLHLNHSSPAMETVAFTGNWGGNWGGAMRNMNSSSPSLVNAIFSGNWGAGGAGMANTASSPSLVNVTFAGNYSGNVGGIYNDNSFPSLTNCLLWGDFPSEIGNSYGGNPTVSYSLIQGGYSGTGNLSADPLFVAPLSPDLAPTSAGNYRLRYGSPAIDAGLDSAISLTKDLDGKPRKIDGSGGSSPKVDMGAYEWQRYLLTVHTVGSGTISRNPDLPAFTTLDTAVLTATASAGWNFVGWSGDRVSGANRLEVTITGSTNLTATFSQVTYPLNVALVGSGLVSKNPDQTGYGSGTVVTLTATADPGWSFAGWSGDVTDGANPLSLTITGATNLTATFTQTHYTLFVAIVGGGQVSRLPDQPDYLYGQAITLTATADPGWSFAGWSGDRTGSANPLKTAITANTSITSTFTQDHYRLNLSGSGMGSLNITPRQTDYLYGTVITLTATPDPGWYFAGWTGAVTGKANPLIITITHDMTLAVHFSTNWLYLPLVNKFKAP